MMSPAELAALLAAAAAEAKFGLVTPTETLMKAIAEEAKKAVGTYEFGWAKLGPDAVARHGDTPLRDTGALEESIVGEAESMFGGAEGAVGSDDHIAYFHEFGTKRMPPRSIFAMAMMIFAPELAPAIYEAFAAEILGFAK